MHERGTLCDILILTFQLLLCSKATPSIAGKNITVIVRNESTAAAQAFSAWLNVSPPKPRCQKFTVDLGIRHSFQSIVMGKLLQLFDFVILKYFRGFSLDNNNFPWPDLDDTNWQPLS